MVQLCELSKRLYTTLAVAFMGVGVWRLARGGSQAWAAIAAVCLGRGSHAHCSSGDDTEVLSIDGGRIRGLIPLVIISFLEKKLQGKPLYISFVIWKLTLSSNIA